jgi:hypothetical protein
MNEQRYCMDCNELREMTIHGRCGTCNSSALAYPEGVALAWPAPSVKCDDLERLRRLAAV